MRKPLPPIRSARVTILMGGFLCLSTAILPATQSLRDAVLRGKISLGGKTMDYSLQVVYQPDGWLGHPEINTSVRSITMTLGKHVVVFPRRAFRYFRDAAAPEAPFTSYPDNTHGRFYLSGGDGEKSYRLAFEFNGDGLLTRELYRHMETTPEVMHFNQRDR